MRWVRLVPWQADGRTSQRKYGVVGKYGKRLPAPLQHRTPQAPDELLQEAWHDTSPCSQWAHEGGLCRVTCTSMFLMQLAAPPAPVLHGTESLAHLFPARRQPVLQAMGRARAV